MSADPRQELEELARKGAENRAERERQEARAQQKRERSEAREREGVLEVSLRTHGLRNTLALMGVLVVGLGFTIGVPSALELGAWGQVAVIALGSLGMVGAGTYLMLKQFRRDADEGRAWVRSIGYGFDPELYLALLSRKESSWSLEARIEFEGEVPEAERSRFSWAVSGVHPAAQVRWEGSALCVTSPLESTYFMPAGDGENYYSNKPLHLFFRKLVEQCLPPMHAARPIKRLSAQHRS